MDMKERINKEILYIYIYTNLIYFYELVKVDLPKLHLIKTEFIFWEVKWTETKDISNTVINTLNNMSR